MSFFVRTVLALQALLGIAQALRYPYLDQVFDLTSPKFLKKPWDLSDILAKRDGGFWGIYWDNGGCNGDSNAVYGAYNNTGIGCYNLAVAKPWDSAELILHPGLQVMFYEDEDCITSRHNMPCSIYSHEHDGPNGICVTSAGDGPTGNHFAKSVQIIDTQYNGDDGPANAQACGAGLSDGGAVGPLTTFSAFPSTATWSSTTSVFANTHDSSNHPVLAPYPQCWFCPPGSGGIALIGFSVGVYPPGGPPPGLPTPFPRLTILPDGNPDYDPSSISEPTTSSGCSTEAVTDTIYYVSTIDDGSTTETTTYSTGTTVTSGCDLRPSATTTTATGGSCPLQYQYGAAPINDGDDDDYVQEGATGSNGPAQPAKRGEIKMPQQTHISTTGASAALSRAPVPSSLSLPFQVPGYARGLQPNATFPEDIQRGTRTITKLGACVLASKVREPNYLAPTDLTTREGPVYWFLATQTADPHNQGCLALPQITKVPTFMDQAVTAGGPRYQLPMQGQSSDEAVVSSDHVYEWGNLARFLRFRLANGVDCQDFNNFFFGEVNRMAIVVGEMPSVMYPNFAGMDKRVNNRKGNIYEGSLENAANANDAAGLIAEYGMAAAAINDPDFIELFRRSHLLMSMAFSSIDGDISDLPAGTGPGMKGSLKPDWQESYLNWMSGYLETVGERAAKKATNYYGKLEAGPYSASLMATYPPDAFSLASMSMTQGIAME